MKYNHEKSSDLVLVFEFEGSELHIWKHSMVGQADGFVGALYRTKCALALQHDSYLFEMAKLAWHSEVENV